MSISSHRFDPDYAVPPGEILQEALDSLGLSQADLARKTSRPLKTVNEIVRGKAAITHRTAIQLERVLGIPASLWNRLEADYRDAIARKEDLRRLADDVHWVDRFPIAAMVSQGLIEQGPDKVSTLVALLSYFGVSSPDALDSVFPSHKSAYFRQSMAYSISDAAVAVWLRWGEREAALVRTKPFDAVRFREALQEIRAMTGEGPEIFESVMKQLSAEAGVVILILPDVPGTRASGATRWITPERAVIQLTIRGKYNDRFWFTFFHEAAHLLLHGRRDAFVEDVEEDGDPAKEAEANRWAADFLIPPKEFDSLLRSDYQNPVVIQSFAAKLRIAPGIVVGRLQNAEKLGWRTPLNRLKRKFEMRS
jgi:HTH-type transcriptional regulator/antitoxin HigA